MKIIPSNNYNIIVDDDDYEYFSQWKWKVGKRGYAVRSIYHSITNGKKLYKDITLHRLAIRARPGEVVDHINGDKLDNRKENLRICTQAENCKNTKLPRHNTSGYKGVSFVKHIKKWNAYISVNNKKVNLGYFKDKTEAATAYNEAAKKNYGKFAALNPINPVGDR